MEMPSWVKKVGAVLSAVIVILLGLLGMSNRRRKEAEGLLENSDTKIKDAELKGKQNAALEEIAKETAKIESMEAPTSVSELSPEEAADYWRKRLRDS